MTENQELHLIIIGKVQGVGFRYFTQKRANRLGLTGWVKNLADGSVEVTVQGEKATLEEFIIIINQAFNGAEVVDLVVSWAEPTDRYAGFQVHF
jgi:acylphosphatase